MTFNGASLKNANFSGLDISHWSFIKAHLQGADLGNFGCAGLRKTDLTNFSIPRNLYGATMDIKALQSFLSSGPKDLRKITLIVINRRYKYFSTIQPNESPVQTFINLLQQVYLKNGRWQRIKAGAWNRHHIEKAQEILKKFHEDGPGRSPLPALKELYNKFADPMTTGLLYEMYQFCKGLEECKSATRSFLKSNVFFSNAFLILDDKAD